jgi:hypothetical protein
LEEIFENQEPRRPRGIPLGPAPPFSNEAERDRRLPVGAALPFVCGVCETWPLCCAEPLLALEDLVSADVGFGVVAEASVGDGCAGLGVFEAGAGVDFLLILSVQLISSLSGMYDSTEWD